MLEAADSVMVFNGLDNIAEKLANLVWEEA